MIVNNTTQPQTQTFTVTLTVEEIRSLAHVHAFLGSMGQEMRKERNTALQQLSIQPVHNPELKKLADEINGQLKHFRTTGALLDRLIPETVISENERGDIYALFSGGVDL